MILLSPCGDLYSDCSALELMAIRTQISLVLASGETALKSATSFVNWSRGCTFGCHASPRVMARFMAALLVPPIQMDRFFSVGCGSKTVSLKSIPRTRLLKLVSPLQSALRSRIDASTLLPLLRKFEPRL